MYASVVAYVSSVYMFLHMHRQCMPCYVRVYDVVLCSVMLCLATLLRTSLVVDPAGDMGCNPSDFRDDPLLVCSVLYHRFALLSQEALNGADRQAIIGGCKGNRANRVGLKFAHCAAPVRLCRMPYHLESRSAKT